MSKFSRLMKLAVVAGPTVLEVVRKLGPSATKLMKDNPEVFRIVQSQVDRMAQARKASHGPEGLKRRIAILREQVDYLKKSADDATELRRAEDWSRRLNKLEASVVLLGAMGKEAARKEEEGIGRRIDQLSADILQAFIEETHEDAQKGELGWR